MVCECRCKCPKVTELWSALFCLSQVFIHVVTSCSRLLICFNDTEHTSFSGSMASRVLSSSLSVGGKKAKMCTTICMPTAHSFQLRSLLQKGTKHMRYKRCTWVINNYFLMYWKLASITVDQVCTCMLL